FPIFIAARTIWDNEASKDTPKQKDYPIVLSPALTVESMKSRPSNYLPKTMTRRKKIPDSVWAVIHEKLEILVALDYHVKPLTEYQYRINGVIDIYPVNKKWHDLRNSERGEYQELVSLVKSKISK